ncbi:MAG: ubiquitin carboxyl-terminal hydrolase [Chlamydiales bacterium]|jgi:hypothetical protein|nr:ubiquitin carboxyl-terminal hydrolase [Chlamydiales bacterium]
MGIANSIDSFYTAKSSVSSTYSTGNRLSPILYLHGKSYHLTVYHKKPDSAWEEITQSYLEQPIKIDFQQILQEQIKLPCGKIEITTSVLPRAHSTCKVQCTNGTIRKIPFSLTESQSIEIFKVLEEMKNLKNIEQRSVSDLSSSLAKESVSLKISLEETKRERIASYLEQVVALHNKPVGFQNKSMNCGFNSCLQMILNEPALLHIYTTVAIYYAKSAKKEDRECGNGMLSILDSYDQAIEEQKPIPEEVSNKLRLAMHYLSPREIASKHLIQEDASEILTILFAENEEILKKQNVTNTSSIHYTFENVTHYLSKKVLKETPHKDCSSLNPDHTYRQEEMGYGIKINLDENQKWFALSSLLEKYLCNEEIGIGSEIRRYMVNGLYTEVSPVKEEIKFSALPKDLFIHFARFKADRTKFTDPIEIPEQLDPTLFHVKNSPSGSYELSSFIVHLGSSLNGGHYITYRKVQDQWIECNDGWISPCSKEQALKAAKQSYICFYRFKEGSIPQLPT